MWRLEMKVLLLVIAILMIPTMCFGAFLVCDPQSGVTSYTVEITQGPNISTQDGIPAQADGSLRLDLATLTQPGNYTFKAKACNEEWGCGEWSSPFSATKPGTPGNVRIIQ